MYAVTERTTSRHNERKIHRFTLNNESFDIVMTQHGHYRILQDRGIDFNELGRIITGVGRSELDGHFKEAARLYPLDRRTNVDWKTQIDYVISVYDMVHKIVIMVGLHPHLKRMTIVTLIPRINSVASNNVFGCYRIDNEKTKNERMDYKIPRGLKMINKNLTYIS